MFDVFDGVIYADVETSLSEISAKWFNFEIALKSIFNSANSAVNLLILVSTHCLGNCKAFFAMG
jgi:hypothetical protein